MDCVGRGRPSLTLRVMIGEGKWSALDGAPSLTLRVMMGENRWSALDGAPSLTLRVMIRAANTIVARS